MGTQKCGTPGSLLSRCLDGNRSEALQETDHGKSTTTILQLPCPAVWRALRGQQHPGQPTRQASSSATTVVTRAHWRFPRVRGRPSSPTSSSAGSMVSMWNTIASYGAIAQQGRRFPGQSTHPSIGSWACSTTTCQPYSSRAAADRKRVQYEVHPDDPQYANGISFPEEHKNLNAYDVVQMATERSRLEADIGKAFTGATTSSVRLERHGNIPFLDRPELRQQDRRH